MKFSILALIVALSLSNCHADYMSTVTMDGHLEWFPLKTDYLKFSVKAKSDVYVWLTDTRTAEPGYYRFVIGGWNNTKSEIRKDAETNVMATADGSILKGSEYRTFSITVNEQNGDVTLSTGQNHTVMQFKDTKMMEMEYFAISSAPGVKASWMFHFDQTFGCNCPYFDLCKS